jgi:hypothetical protein
MNEQTRGMKGIQTLKQGEDEDTKEVISLWNDSGLRHC